MINASELISYKSKNPVKNIDQLDALSNKFLSRKGLVANLFLMMRDVDLSDRPQAGNELNCLKEFISKEISVFNQKFSPTVDNDLNIDHSLPGKLKKIGIVL